MDAASSRSGPWSPLVVRLIGGGDAQSVHILSEILPRSVPRRFMLRARLTASLPWRVVEHCDVLLTMREDRDDFIGFDVPSEASTPCLVGMPQLDRLFASCVACYATLDAAHQAEAERCPPMLPRATLVR